MLGTDTIGATRTSRGSVWMHPGVAVLVVVAQGTSATGPSPDEDVYQTASWRMSLCWMVLTRLSRRPPSSSPIGDAPPAPLILERRTNWRYTHLDRRLRRSTVNLKSSV